MISAQKKTRVFTTVGLFALCLACAIALASCLKVEPSRESELTAEEVEQVVESAYGVEVNLMSQEDDIAVNRGFDATGYAEAFRHAYGFRDGDGVEFHVYYAYDEYDFGRSNATSYLRDDYRWQLLKPVVQRVLGEECGQAESYPEWEVVDAALDPALRVTVRNYDQLDEVQRVAKALQCESYYVPFPDYENASRGEESPLFESHISAFTTTPMVLVMHAQSREYTDQLTEVGSMAIFDDQPLPYDEVYADPSTGELKPTTPDTPPMGASPELAAENQVDYIRRMYVDMVRFGTIEEELPDEEFARYPAYNVNVTVVVDAEGNETSSREIEWFYEGEAFAIHQTRFAQLVRICGGTYTAEGERATWDVGSHVYEAVAHEKGHEPFDGSTPLSEVDFYRDGKPFDPLGVNPNTFLWEQILTPEQVGLLLGAQIAEGEHQSCMVVTF